MLTSNWDLNAADPNSGNWQKWLHWQLRAQYQVLQMTSSNNLKMQLRTTKCAKPSHFHLGQTEPPGW